MSNVGAGPQFWAAPFELDNEFGGLGFPAAMPPDALVPVAKGRPGENTTIAIVATDATLSKAQAKQFAIMAQDGLARAITQRTLHSTVIQCLLLLRGGDHSGIRSTSSRS